MPPRPLYLFVQINVTHHAGLVDFGSGNLGHALFNPKTTPLKYITFQNDVCATRVPLSGPKDNFSTDQALNVLRSGKRGSYRSKALMLNGRLCNTS
jgi:hypothetical protein